MSERKANVKTFRHGKQAGESRGHEQRRVEGMSLESEGGTVFYVWLCRDQFAIVLRMIKDQVGSVIQ